MLLITFRPEFEPPWTGLPNVTSLTLRHLDKHHAQSLAQQVTGQRALPAEVMAQIVAKTDGVPLFIEELTKMVQESGLLVEAGGHYRLDGPLPPFAIPTTRQDSLMARLDRLASVKEVAQIGAAIGREFSYALLSQVMARDEASLQAALAQLEDAGLLFRTSAPPEARYMFKHALVQDTAYESLLKSRRQVLHKRIVEALRDKFPAVATTEPEVLAHHYTQAGLGPAAVEWWGKAGQQALRRAAFVEAISHYEKAIRLADEGEAGPEDRVARLRLQIAYGNGLMAARGYGAETPTVAAIP
jgi:predicted ATPase